MTRRLDRRHIRDPATLDALPPDGAHGAALIERLRFGPPETWLGWRRGSGKVAVKIFPVGLPLPENAAAMAAFRHPGVVPLLDWGGNWMVFAWVEGPTLARAGIASAETLCTIAEAVAALHRAGLAHGDLTPSNVVAAAGGPALIDWGMPGAGTPGWRPDRMAATPSERDLYALGLPSQWRISN